MAEENVTTKIGIDISELKKNITEANRRIRSLNAEFKSATAGMDSWSDSTDGLAKKVEQMTGIVEQEKIKLSALEEQYKQIAETQGKDSKAAEELYIKMKNQEAAVGRASASLKKYTEKLNETTKEEQKSKGAFASLEEEISNQEKELDRLKDGYKDAVLKFGETSKEANTFREDIKKLSGELADNKSKAEQLSASTDSLDKSLEKTKQAAEKSKDGFSSVKVAIGNLISEGIKKMAVEAGKALKEVTDESQQAYNSFQAMTGTSTEEMSKYKKQIDELYKNNYGESMKDVAGVMAEIKQQTGEIDPSKLKEMAENAITMRDTFGQDTKEQLRAVKMMMDQFGISSEEAYNLIAQGAQQGLDKNGDLLDSINEYSVHYKQLGYSAEDFMNMLKNGTDAGTFSVDKLGDATKEFGIRSKDTASSTQEGFKLLGYSASASADEIDKTKDEISKLEKNLKYAKLEQDGFKKSTSELTKLKNADKIKEYSKQLEDAKAKLKTMQGASKNTSGSIKKLQDSFAKGGDSAKKATKEVLKKLMDMDDKVAQNQAGVDLFGTMWEDLGVKGVEALMKTKGEMKKTKKTMEEIKKVKYDDVTSKYKQIGRTVQLDLFVPLAEKLAPTLESITNYMINNAGEIKKGIVAIGTAAAVWFARKKINAIAESLALLKTKFVLLKSSIEGATVAQKILNIVQSMSPGTKILAGVGLLTAAVLAFRVATSKAAEASDKESKSLDEMKKRHEETSKSVEKMTKEWKELKEARDKSVSDTTAQFDYYKKLKDELDDMVDKNGKVKKSQKDRAKFIVTTLNDALGTELKMTGRVIKNYEKEKKSIDKLIETKKAQLILDTYKDSYTKAVTNKSKAATNKDTAEANLKETQKKLEAAKKELKAAQDTKKLERYIKEAGGGRAGQISGSRRYNQELEAARGNEKKLREQEKKNKKTFENAEKQYSQYCTTITNWEALSVAAASGNNKKIKKELTKMVNNFITAENGTEKSLKNQVENTKKQYENLNKQFKEGKAGITKEDVNNAKYLMQASDKALKKFEKKAKKSGQKTTKEYKEGLEIGKNKAGKSAEDISKLVEKKMKGIKSKEAGENFVKGLKTGMEKGKQSSGLIAKVGKLADNMLSKLKEKLEIHSPSKKTEEIGKYFTIGTAKGIEKAYDTVGRAIAALAKKSLSQLKKANQTGKYEDIGTKVSEAYANGITKQEQKAEKAVKKLVDRAVKKAQKETKNKKSKESFKKLGENLAESFSTAFSKAAEKATEKVQKKIESMTSSVQEKYDAVKDLQDDLQSRLSSGDLFTKDDDGKITLADFKSETAKIIQYGKNMEALKKTLSSELMTEIAALDTSDGLDLTTKLLSLNKQELAAYNKAYTDKINASKKVANTYYAERVKQIKDNYTKQVKTVMAGLEKQLENIGENAMKGFVKGFNSKSAELNKSAKQLKKTLVSSIKKELEIHSPSKVMDREAGVFIIPGLTKGIERKLPALRQMMQRVRENVVNPMKNAATTANLDVATRGARSIEKAAAATTNTYNFYQTNNSPKALSRWDIYRQSRNLLGGVSNV